MLSGLETAYNVNHPIVIEPNFHFPGLALTALEDIYGRLLADADYCLDRNIDYVFVLINNNTCTAAHPRTQPIAFPVQMNLCRINLQIGI